VNGSLTSEIRTRLVGGGSGTGRLPSGDVDGLEVLGHLGQLHGVQCAVGVGGGAGLVMLRKEAEQFLGLDIGRVDLGQGAALADDLLGRVRSDQALEAIRLRPETSGSAI
jgi:hypothetical protein